MTVHIFANVVTPYGTAANNRGETEGNTTTLQKLVWKSQVHTTVSAEAIRFALRRLFAESGEETNRYWDEDVQANVWNDPEFKGWGAAGKGTKYIDDDVLGYMRADAAKEEGKAGTATIRRAVLEISRAVSLTPWSGDISFNAASPGATPSAAKSKKETSRQNPVPYGVELHATRYQFGLAMTPDRLADKSHAAKALDAIGSLRSVAGNHGRFLYDFSPEMIVIRITDDPAPRILYCFDTEDGGKTVNADVLFQRIASGDVLPAELLVGVLDVNSEFAEALKEKGVAVSGVRAAIAAAKERLQKSLK